MSRQHFLLKAMLLCSIAIVAGYSFTKQHSSSSPRVVSVDITQALLNHQPIGVAQVSMPQEPKVQIINHIVAAGETLGSLWEQYGESAQDAVKVIEDVRDQGLQKLGLRKGESIKLAVSSEGELLNFEKRLDDGRTLLVKRSDSEAFETEIVPVEIDEVERTLTGTIQDSLAATAQTLGVSYAVVDDIVDLFSSRIRFTKDIQPGDSFAIRLIEKRSKRDNSLIGEPAIQEASFTINGKLLAVFGERGSDSKIHFVDESGESMGNYFLRYPVTFTRISSYFTFARFHPVLQRNRPHLGVDFAAPVGTAVRSVADGVITEIAFKKEPGNWIKIQHNDRWSTAYMHLHSFAPGLKRGMKISRGQLIGGVGSTGLSTGAHLHFSLYDNDKYVDPLTTDLPQMENNAVKIPKIVMTQRLEALRALHEKTKIVALATAGTKQLS